MHGHTNVKTSTHITKSPTQLSKHPHITKPTHTHTHTLQNPHIHTPTRYYEFQSRDHSPSPSFVSHLSRNVPDHCHEHPAVVAKQPRSVNLVLERSPEGHQSWLVTAFHSPFTRNGRERFPVCVIKLWRYSTPCSLCNWNKNCQRNDEHKRNALYIKFQDHFVIKYQVPLSASY